MEFELDRKNLCGRQNFDIPELIKESKPFSKTNAFLIKNDMTPIDWSNPDV